MAFEITMDITRYITRSEAGVCWEAQAHNTSCVQYNYGETEARKAGNPPPLQDVVLSLTGPVTINNPSTANHRRTC